ncbi:DUF1592 domain-containing protein [Tundrisphaera sp. TA3]|uniref:DUF1592 domain-containing protein n=1 Tax=Tundrisphaera sp. TA3 TaxID=3435775 RepID=UPI003EBEAD60
MGRDATGARIFIVGAAVLLGLAGPIRAEGGEAGAAYQSEIRPLIARYCQECHAGDRVEGDLDLEEFAAWDEARKHPRAWQKVGAMLDGGQMPPKDARQPTDAERAKLKAWVHDYLTTEARKQAGDPGRVVLRRLGNAEYTYTLRDLTGLDDLSPAREFPVDGAAGEGFTNTGNALVMSPALVTKYLDAAKGVAAHAVLLPDGFRFSPTTTPSDWTNEGLARIRDFYRAFTDPRGGNSVVVQGLVFETNQGGRLPLERYLAATLAGRDALRADPSNAIANVARDHGLSPKYLGILWRLLADESHPSPMLDGLRGRWKAAGPGEAGALAAEVEGWQGLLWRFNLVGHIGKVGGPKAWMEPISPIVARQEIRQKLPAVPDGGEVVLSLAVGDAGDGSDGDLAVWERPRLVVPGRPDLLLRDAGPVARDLAARRARIIDAAAQCLAIADDVGREPGAVDLPALASKHGVPAEALSAWLEALGLDHGGPVSLGDPITRTVAGFPGFDAIKGWVGDEALSVLANPTDQAASIPGTIPPHSVAVHPTPTRQVVVGWRSPGAAGLRVSGMVRDAHLACGNGVAWSLELRRGRTRQALASGVTDGGKPAPISIADPVEVRPGDALALVVGPRDGSHVCDLTAIALTLQAGDRSWDLGRDVSADILAGNPHADASGTAGVWHFASEPIAPATPGAVIPAGSMLARWRSSADPAEKAALADQVRAMLRGEAAPAPGSPDAALRGLLLAPAGPLMASTLRPARDTPADRGDPRFGTRPDGVAVDPASLAVRAPGVVEFRLPADLAAGAEFVASGLLHPEAGREGSVQFRAVVGPVAAGPGLGPGPIVARDGSAAKRRIEASLDEFRQAFPAALCYTKIVPIDEAVTLTLVHREDEPLRRLMLDDAQSAQLDRMWEELHFIGQDAIKLVDVFAQLLEYASQDADPKVFEPLRPAIMAGADALRRKLVAAEPVQIDALVRFAARAYRRPLADGEAEELRGLYGRLREQGLPHDEAFRLTLARILVAPAFLYRAEVPAPGVASAPVSNWEMANRLSYFLWASPPDDELRGLAASGRLRDPDVVAAQARRMVKDGKARRLATEFACQWLHVYEFDQLDEKSEQHFPTFVGLRGAMYEETIRFLADLFQQDRPVLDVLDADHTFLNEALAAHYEIPGVAGPEWRRVDGLKGRGRGGVLAQATTLAKQSGASRTSPTLRGNWISEVLLGERLPRPPKDIPQLPEDESATEGLTVRQLVEQHASNPKCATCHVRIDPMGFALEAFDPVGRLRTKDLGDRPIDVRAKAADGAEFAGLDGLRGYLLTARRDAFVRQFCRKLLGYALGRAVQLSDEPLLDEMQAALKARDHAVGAAIEVVVRSRPFREIRGRDRVDDDE